jgi:hypothetical protein
MGTSWGTHWELKEHIENFIKTCKNIFSNTLGTWGFLNDYLSCMPFSQVVKSQINGHCLLIKIISIKIENPTHLL